MSDPPERWKTDPESLTPDEHLRHLRGERIENPAYRKAKAEALREAGLEEEAAELERREPKPEAEQTADEHFRAVQEASRPG